MLRCHEGVVRFGCHSYLAVCPIEHCRDVGPWPLFPCVGESELLKWNKYILLILAHKLKISKYHADVKVIEVS